ncbi:MAG: universal stress protein [Caldivirga sp.]|jgi:ACR3 family arsenite efflux pump ArsB/nucleotide-binding universal stress UspA family protein|nr:universal stress protein [Caldivirga sp.]
MNNLINLSQRTKLEKIRDHLDKFLGLYVGLAIIIGLIAGYYDAAWAHSHIALLQNIMLASVYVMIFPMMLMLNIKALGNAFRNWKLVTAVILLNFAYGPLMAVLLGNLFLINPYVRLGLFLAWVVPCSSMSIGYVGLMKADVSAATAMVALSFILSLALIPTEASLYIHNILASERLALSSAMISKIEMNLVITIIEILIVPLALAIPTREAMIRKMGQEKFRRISPLFPTLTMLGMITIIFTIFFAHADVLITHIMDVLGVFYSAMVFGSVSLTVFTILFKYIKLNRRNESPYSSSMVAILTGIPKNEATAIALSAVALAPLGPQVAFMASMPPSLLPAFQVVFIIVFLKLREKIIDYYGARKEIEEILKVREIPARGVVSEEKEVSEVVEVQELSAGGVVSKTGLNILVPVDFSRGTEEWIREGLGRLNNVNSITLLHVIPLSLSEVSDFVTEDVIKSGKKIAEHKMRELVKTISTFGPYEVSYEIAVGDPARIILEQANAGKFDMIMMGHRGYGYAETFFVGSVTLKVISRSPIPVMVIRKNT